MWASGKKVAGGAAGFTSRFKVKRASNQSIPNTTWTKVEWNSKVYDNDTEFDIVTNHRFTATATGLYQLNCTLALATPGTANPVEAQFQLNGASGRHSVNNLGVATVTNNRLNMAGDFYMTAGQYMEIYMQHIAGAARDLDFNDSRFSGHRVQ